jgi:hypothetical protein
LQGAVTLKGIALLKYKNSLTFNTSEFSLLLQQ